MKSRLKPFLSLLGLSIILGACLGEGDFVGNKEENSRVTNGPFSMKIVTVSGGTYLAVLNTNYRFKQANGSLQFYDIGTTPTLSTAVEPLSLPSNCSDFEIYAGSLYVLNRNRSELWVYDLDGNQWIRRQTAAGQNFFLKLPANPTQIFPTTQQYSGGTRTFLAVVAPSAGTISFVDPSTVTIPDPTKLTTNPKPNAGIVAGRDTYGAQFYMNARTDPTTEKKTSIGVAGLRRSGVGITGALSWGNYLSDQFDRIVGYNALALAVHTFQLRDMVNSQNYTWDLSDWQHDKTIDNVVRKGTKENGFRGIDKDDYGNVFLTSRTDNSIFMLLKTDIVMIKDDRLDAENTWGFEKNTRPRRIDIDNFQDETDPTTRPRLDEIVVEKANYQSPDLTNRGAPATVAWVTGLGAGQVFRVSLTGSSSGTVTHRWTLSTAREFASPQRLLRYDAGGIHYLFVADTLSDRIFTMNADNLNPFSTVQLN